MDISSFVHFCEFCQKQCKAKKKWKWNGHRSWTELMNLCPVQNKKKK